MELKINFGKRESMFDQFRPIQLEPFTKPTSKQHLFALGIFWRELMLPCTLTSFEHLCIDHGLRNPLSGVHGML